MHCYVPKPRAKRPRRVGSAAVLFPLNVSPSLLLRVFLCVGDTDTVDRVARSGEWRDAARTEREGAATAGSRKAGEA